jgi:hypothetical protein
MHRFILYLQLRGWTVRYVCAKIKQKVLFVMRNNEIMVIAFRVNVVPCNLVYICQHCRGDSCLSLQGKGSTPKYRGNTCKFYIKDQCSSFL